MANQIIMRNAVVLAKTETTYGIDSAPEAANAMLVSVVNINPLAGSAIDLNYVKPYMGGQPSMRTEDYVTCSMTCDLVGNANASTPGAPYDALRQACGVAKTTQAAISSTMAAGSTTSSLVLNAGASSTDHAYAGMSITVNAETRTIIAYVGSTKTATVYPALSTAPASSDAYSITASSYYTPISTGFKGATLYFNQDGLRHKLVGARGNAALDMSANGRPIIKFDMTGMFSPVTDAVDTASFSSGWGAPQTVNTANTMAYIDGKLSDGSATGIQAMKWTMDFGNSVKHRQLIGSESVPITDRLTKGTTSIEMTTVAFNAWIERIRASTKGPMVINHGLTLGNIVSCFLVNSQLTDPAYSDSDGIVMLDMNFNAITLNGNDEFRMFFK
jgi:hypothetical protein